MPLRTPGSWRPTLDLAAPLLSLARILWGARSADPTGSDLPEGYFFRSGPVGGLRGAVNTSEGAGAAAAARAN